MMKTYQNHAMTDAEARQALADACKQVETNLPLYTYQCQNHSSVNDIYPGCANNQWTCGFWPGEIWLAYEATGDEKFQDSRPHSGGQLCGPHCPQGGGGPPRYGLFVQPHLRGSVEAGGQRNRQKRRLAAADQLLTRYQPAAASCRHGALWTTPATTAISLTACSMCRCCTGQRR